MEIGSKIRELRKGRGWRQIDLADHVAGELGEGTDTEHLRVSISRWERGIVAPNDTSLHAVAKAFGTTFQELVMDVERLPIHLRNAEKLGNGTQQRVAAASVVLALTIWESLQLDSIDILVNAVDKLIDGAPLSLPEQEAYAQLLKTTANATDMERAVLIVTYAIQGLTIFLDVGDRESEEGGAS